MINDTAKSETVLYKYNDQNQQWTQMGPIMPYDNSQDQEIEAIVFGRYQGFAVSPTNENTLYKSRVEYIDISTDGGETWQHLNNNKHDDTHWICFENEDPNKIWLGTDGGVHYTNDAFNTIVDKTNGIGVANVYNVTPSQRNSNTILMGAWDCGNNLLHSDSSYWGIVYGGDGFKGLINDNYEDSISLHCSASGATPARSYEISPDYNFTGWWYDTNDIGTNGWGHHMTNDFTDNDIIYYPGYYRVGRSLDNGVTWESISSIANEDSLNILYN